MINYYKKRVKDKRLKKLSSFEIGSWISVINPSKKEINFLSKNFNLEKRNLVSGLDQDEIPRLDFIGKDIYIFTKDLLFPRTKQTLLIIIGEKFILTLSQEEPSFLQALVNEKIDFYTTQKRKFLIKILFLLNERLEQTTSKTIREVKTNQSQDQDLSEKDLKELLEEENFLNKLIASYQYVLVTYKRAAKKIKFLEADKELLEDLIEDTNQVFNLCKSALKNISNIRKYYHILLSNRLNKTINTLTIFTVLISLPNLIAGLYGMNVTLPFENDPFAFWYIIFSTLVLIFFFALYLRNKKII
jgi:magnesium transporter